ncbi:MAG: hypothetical protein HY902_00465, partial [Deltaproteobacteria bacterium]|nr:hypothetical protein [Deltaproteobacteria bacterium]
MRRKVATGLGLLLWTALAGCGQTAGQSGGGWYAVDAAANSDGSTGPVDDGAADAGDSGATDDDATPADDATGPGEDATAGSDTEDDAADSAEPADSAVASDVADVAGAVDSGPVADADAAADTKDASVATDSGSGADAKDVADTLDAVSPADTAGGGDTKDAVVLQDSGPVADSGPAGDASADAAKDSAADSGDAGGDTTTPPPPGIPYLANFACGAGAGGWVLDKPSSGSKAVWAIDATPAQPAAPGDGCSLNFNDGAGFACTSSFYATATSPAIDASKVAPGTTLVLRFALAGTWPSDFTANLAVKASGDGSNYKFLAGPDAPGLTWKTQAFDVSAFAGGKLWLQFVFYTTNCSAPVGTGPFIDALEVVPLGCVAAKCDDGNVCSQDGCDLAGDACSHVDQPAAACEDGSACTVGDFCLDLQCISGVGPYCSDGNPCTSDGCDAKGCVYTPLDCNDGNLCTTDSCGAGGCSHAAKVCDDKNPCTADACVNGSCTAAPASGPCSDGNPCTGPDTCSGGQCQAGPASGCDDGNVCTSDACVGGTCTATPSSGPCSDGNACTGPDACSSGACKAGAATNCDDGDACTTDACSATSGVCSHTPGGLCGKPAKTLPYSMKFGCTDPELAAWTATGTPGGPSFAFDANPAWYPFTGYHSYGCSANFN